MKTLILTAIISLVTLSNFSLEASETTSKYQGQARINVDYYRVNFINELFRDSSMEKIQLNAEFTELESGRGSIRLTSDMVNQCNGFTTLIYAEQDGFGVYDLYASKEAWTNGEKLGTAIKKRSVLQINFTTDKFFSTSVGRRGSDCSFDLGNNFYSEFSLKK